MTGPLSDQLQNITDLSIKHMIKALDGKYQKIKYQKVQDIIYEMFKMNNKIEMNPGTFF